MFEWFFGNSKKKELKGFDWLKGQLEKTPASQEELDEVFSEIETVIRDLDRTSLKLYLKDEDIIEKCLRLDIEILQHKPVEEIKRTLESYEASLREHLNSILEAMEIVKKEVGPPKQIFAHFKELVECKLEGISKNMKELVKLYDFLEHIHLSPEEIEFYVMKKRGKTKNISNLAFYIKGSEYIVYRTGDGEIKKKSIVFITGTEKIYHPSNKKSRYGHTDKHIRLIISGRGTPRGSQFLKKFKDVNKSMNLVWEGEKTVLERGACTLWNRPTLYFLIEFDSMIGEIREKRKKSRTVQIELNIEAGKNALLHGYPV